MNVSYVRWYSLDTKCQWVNRLFKFLKSAVSQRDVVVHVAIVTDTWSIF